MGHRNRKKDFFFTIYTYSLITIVLVLFFTFATNIYYFRLLLEETEKRYENSLEQVSDSIDTLFREIIDTASLISNYEEFNELLFHPGDLTASDYGRFFETQQILSRFKTAKDSYVYSVFVILSYENRVISNTGSSTIGEFARITHVSDQYDSLNWLFLDYSDRDFLLLPPGTVRNESMGSESAVIPLVIFQLENRLFSNPLVIDIRQDSLKELLDSGLQTPNSVLYVQNKERDIILRSTGSEISLPPEQQDDSRIIKLNGRRYLTISYDNPLAIMGEWTIGALVPYRDLINASLDKLTVPLIILTVSLISSTLLAYFLSGRIYSPIGTLISGFRSDNTEGLPEENRGELEFLKIEINRIIEDREKLSRDLDKAVPYVCERFFLSLLNGETLYSKEEIGEFLAGHGISFVQPSFAVLLTSVNFTSEFYNEYSREDHDRICSGILRAFSNYPLEKLTAYHFLMDADRICSIYNINGETSQKELSVRIEELHKQLDINSRTLTMTSGLGRFYNNLSDLKLSYREAVSALGTEDSEAGRISCFTGTGIPARTSYTIEDENVLFNLLLCGEVKRAEEFILQLEKRGVDERSDERERREFYRQLYNTGKRVLTLKKMSDYDLMGEDFINIAGGDKGLRSCEMKEYVTAYLARLARIDVSRSRTLDLETLKSYLTEHFQEDLYLDRIGEEFGITPKYASRLIKRKLGMSFQKYVSRLRITKAKELLMTTGDSVESIARKTGFNSRHTFIRMFKILEGITPSEYRKTVVPHFKGGDSLS